MIHEPLNSTHFAAAKSLFSKFQPPIPFWDLAKFEAELKVAKGFLVRENGEIRGFVLYRVLPQAEEITLLATDPDHQKRGLMYDLVNHWLATRSGARPIWLEVHETNIAARNLYRKLGFKEVGIRPGYYPDGAAAINLTFEPR